MAVTMIEGFDVYNGSGANTGWQTNWTGNLPTTAVNFAAGRFGGQCLRYIGSTGWNGRAITGGARSQGCHGFAFRASSFTGPNSSRIIGLSAANQMLCGINFTTLGAIVANRLNGTNGAGGVAAVLGTSANGVLAATNVWYYIEVEWVISATVGRIKVYVDGVVVLNLTNVNTLTGANANADQFMLDNQGGSGTLDFDDLYETDTAAALGPRRVDTLRGTADTATKQWTPDTGTVNFSRVNANLAQSATFVQASVVGNLDLYDIADLSTTPATIDAVQYSLFAQKTDASVRKIAAVGDIGGTQQQSADFNLATGVARYLSVFSTKPGGGAWSLADVNALRIGPKVTA